MKESWVSNDIGSVGCTLLAEDRHATNARAPNAGVPLNERYIKLLFHSQGLFCISMATFKCSSMCILLHSIDSLTASVECAVLPDQFPRRPACWATQICTVNALGFDIPSSRIYSAVPAPLISESWCHFVFTRYRHVICEDNCADDSISTNPRMKQNATEPSRTLPRLIAGSRSLSRFVGTPWDTTQRYRIKATNIESKISVGPTLEKSLISGLF